MGGPCKRPELGTEPATSECTLPGIKSVTFGFGEQRLTNLAILVRVQGTNFNEVDDMYPFLSKIIFYKFMLWASSP